MSPSEAMSSEAAALREALGFRDRPHAETGDAETGDAEAGDAEPGGAEPGTAEPGTADRAQPAPRPAALPPEAGVRVRRLQTYGYGDPDDAPPAPQDWLVEDLIPMGTVTFISGDGGVGKTLLGQQLHMAAALGLPWLGRPTKQVTGIALFCEDKRAVIKRRAHAIARHHGVGVSDPRLRGASCLSEVGEDNALFGTAWDAESGEPYRVTELYWTLLDWARQRKARLILLDSLHDVFTGNENYRPEAKAFVRALTRMAGAIDGAVVVLAHPSMNGLDRGSGSSGSTAWNNAVRQRLYLTRPEMPRGGRANPRDRLLKVVKSNYGPTGEVIRLKLERGVLVAEER